MWVAKGRVDAGARIGPSRSTGWCTVFATAQKVLVDFDSKSGSHGDADRSVLEFKRLIRTTFQMMSAGIAARRC